MIYQKLDLSGTAGDELFTINPEFTVLSNDKVSKVNLYPTVIDPLQLKQMTLSCNLMQRLDKDKPIY